MFMELTIPSWYNPYSDNNYTKYTPKLFHRRLKFDDVRMVSYLKRCELSDCDPDLKRAYISEVSDVMADEDSARYLLDGRLRFDRGCQAEKSGLGAYSKRYTVVVSFADSLDWVLSNMLKIKDDSLHIEQNLSRAILTQSELLLKEYKVSTLIGRCEELDCFLAYILNNLNIKELEEIGINPAKAQDMSRCERFSYVFNSLIISYCKRITTFIITHFYKYLKDTYQSKVLICSESISEIVIYSDVKLDGSFIIQEEAFGTPLEIFINSYEELEYANNINRMTSARVTNNKKSKDIISQPLTATVNI